MESSSSNIFVPKKDLTANWIPEGFVLLIGPDEEKYIVLEFLVDSFDQDYYSYIIIIKLSGALGTVSFSHSVLHRGQKMSGCPGTLSSLN